MTAEAVLDKPKNKTAPTYFIWGHPIMRRRIILEGQKEVITEKGRQIVHGTGDAVVVSYGLLKAETATANKLRKHPNYGKDNKGRGFREATPEEVEILDSLMRRKVAQKELVKRMRLILRTQNPDQKLQQEGEAF